MAEIPEPLPAGPHIDLKTGSFTQAMRDWLEQNIAQSVTSTITQIGGVISGQAEVRAAAATAQATADAASQGVADVQAGVAAGTITFSAAFSPFTAFGTRLGTGSVTTNSVTVTPTGGTAPYDITVAYLSGDARFSASNPSDTGVAPLSTTFSGSITALGQDKSAVWRATITDAALDTVTVTVGVAIAEIS